MRIDDIILKHDTRGISNLPKVISDHSCFNAANLILDNFGKVFITTGFYILSARSPETDGPPGAIALGNALEKLGYEIVYVTDKYCVSILNGLKSKKSRIIEFPIMNQKKSKLYSEQLINKDKEFKTRE